VTDTFPPRNHKPLIYGTAHRTMRLCSSACCLFCHT
jgi:hypothetical protein